jgi:hypothetical protein
VFRDEDRVGQKYVDRFARWDTTTAAAKDKNMCNGLFELPNPGRLPVLYWDSKMAVDADGASEPVRKQSSGASKDTSLRFSDRSSLNAEIVPYFVVPTYDDPGHAAYFPNAPWERSGDKFVDDFKLRHGNLGVVIFGSKIAGAIFGDEGPAMKIGEASIRVHELIRRPPLPWKGDPARKQLLDASEDKDVLTLVFRDIVFDIDAFGPTRQAEISVEIQKQALEAFDAFIKAQP